MNAKANKIRIFLPFQIALVLAALAANAQETRPVVVIKPSPTPTPQDVVTTPTATPEPVQTLFDLQSRIRGRMLRAELRRGQIGIKIASLNTGRVIFEENAEKYFMPASNMKNFTVAAALERLGPDYRIVTSVYSAAPPDANGTIKGDLRIFGRGDVSISTAFFPPSPNEIATPVYADSPHGRPNEQNSVYFKGLDKLVDEIIGAGVKRVEGNLIGDETYFKGHPIPPSWEWDDLQWYYGAEISALPLNDNALDLKVTPGTPGYACDVKLTPMNPIMRVINTCTTTHAGIPNTLKIVKKLDQNIVEISGTLPVGNDGFTGYLTVSRPAELFIALLRHRLEQKGVTITGQTRVVNTRSGARAETMEIAKLESPPLNVIAAKTMKPSQNMYTETLLWTLGEYARARTGFPTVGGVTGGAADSAELGINEVKSFLTGIGIPQDAVIQHDGSGLSRHNLVTPSAVVQLYTYMAKQSRARQAWMDSLTIGGVDGTLRSRFKGTKAAANVRGKTGTIGQVSALSGYVTTAGGEQLVFSTVVNGVPATPNRTSMIDDIVIALANFNGRVD